eukprot:COSAG01_NODE_42900_length_435_cov_1.211310_1_plen_45_part_10
MNTVLHRLGQKVKAAAKFVYGHKKKLGAAAGLALLRYGGKAGNIS